MTRPARTWPIDVEVEVSQILRDTPPCFPDVEPPTVCDACRARHLLASPLGATLATEGTTA